MSYCSHIELEMGSDYTLSKYGIAEVLKRQKEDKIQAQLQNPRIIQILSCNIR